MEKIKLLDCTLRDGGYINEWEFGEKVIGEMSRKSSAAGSDIVELGFLRDVPYEENIAVFRDVKQAGKFIPGDREKTQYAVMCEAMNPLPVEKITAREDGDVEIIRVIVWKRLLEEGFDYCRGIVEKGYKLCVQPNRVDQYSEKEFVNMVQKFNELNPFALYIVDSFGVLDTDGILRYADLADEYLKCGIGLGYHGHNNLMQAYGTAQKFIERKYHREVFLDASVYGIGRGAGNLNIELIAKYLNEHEKRNYQLDYYMDIYDQFIRDIYQREQWGYLPAYYLTALFGCNPMYGRYYSVERHLKACEIQSVLKMLSGEEKIRFSVRNAEEAYSRFVNTGNK